MNSKKTFIIIFLIIVGGVIFGFSYYLNSLKEKIKPNNPILTPTITSPVNTPPIWQVYNDPEYKFSLKYPLDWKKEERKMGQAVTFSSPKENDLDEFQESVNVTIENLSWRKDKDLITPESYAKESITSLKNSLLDFKLLEGDFYTLDKNPAYKIIFSGVRNGENLKYIMVFTIREPFAYLVTYTAKENKFTDYEKTANEMIESFTLTKN
jgi:serine/threonine-protein kinase